MLIAVLASHHCKYYTNKNKNCVLWVVDMHVVGGGWWLWMTWAWRGGGEGVRARVLMSSLSYRYTNYFFGVRVEMRCSTYRASSRDLRVYTFIFAYNILFYV